jgi:hypothetical protein
VSRPAYNTGENTPKHFRATKTHRKNKENTSQDRQSERSRVANSEQPPQEGGRGAYIARDPHTQPAGLAVEPPDYKFLVFDGRVGFMCVDQHRFGDHRRSFYTPAWKSLDVTYRFRPGRPVPRCWTR